MVHPERRFYFELALALGCTVPELLSRVSSAELVEWAAFFDLRNKEQLLAGGGG